jgi:hypothetical protein
MMAEENPVLTQARAIFPNMGMHRNAEFIAGLHPRAIDYLAQAPVLAAAFGVKAITRSDRLYVAMRIGGPIERGERLRNVMRAVGIQLPLRKLTGFAIAPFLSDFIRELNDLDPSTLSQAIPVKPGAQRKWLGSLKAYRHRMRLNYSSPKIGFSWIARHAHLCEDGRAADFADFIARNPAADFERWSLDRMSNEVELWHDRLAADKSLGKFGAGITPNTVIDLSDWPDHAECEGFEFFKLATPSMFMEEGRRMRHCVASYIPRVMNGDCHVYSVRLDMRRMATLEIVGQKPVQLKAFANRLPAAGIKKAANAFVKDHAPI